MEKFIVIIAFLIICAYGFIKISLKIRKYNDRLTFADEFLNRLRSYVNSTGHNSADYEWMTHRSNKMQNHLGSLGIIHKYKPPYQNVMYSNYPIILNMLPELRTSINDEILRKVAYEYANSLQESLVRHMGCVEDTLEFYAKDLKNPFKWLREGVREVISVPVYLLGWLGIVSESVINKFIFSMIFKVISGIIALVGFASAVFTLVIGWDEFINKVMSLYQ